MSKVNGEVCDSGMPGIKIARGKSAGVHLRRDTRGAAYYTVYSVVRGAGTCYGGLTTRSLAEALRFAAAQPLWKWLAGPGGLEALEAAVNAYGADAWTAAYEAAAAVPGLFGSEYAYLAAQTSGLLRKNWIKAAAL